MKHILLLVAIALFLHACNSSTSNKTIDEDTVKNDTIVEAIKTIPDDSLSNYFYKIDKPEETIDYKEYTSLSDFPKEWVCLTNTAAGLVIYHFNDELNKVYKIDDKEMCINFLPDTKIIDFIQAENDVYTIRLEEDLENQVWGEFSFEIVDKDTMYTILSTNWYSYYDDGSRKKIGVLQELVIPSEKQYLFNHLDSPNKSTAEGVNMIPFDFNN
ncbi:MAG: hypothetical protein C0596_04280 [Marinilabiliales bacterium]|nr:MAG: hypothetical protein C0596_04280 [Marinilabiliales bacterium]